jgi:hypothetical protein
LRWLPRLAVLTVGVAAALTLASPSANAGALDVQDVPADFARVMGYQPVVAHLADGTGRVINPRGSCSVPGHGRPFDFDVACKAHDYGYDRLRYEEKVGHRIPRSARAKIDHQLTADMRAQCRSDASTKTCDATAAVFTAAVTFNTWRQVSGPPDDDSGIPRTAGLVLLGGAGVVLLRRRTVFRRRAAFGGRALLGGRSRTADQAA